MWQSSSRAGPKLDHPDYKMPIHYNGSFPFIFRQNLGPKFFSLVDRKPGQILLRDNAEYTPPAKSVRAPQQFRVRHPAQRFV